ncbi:hypothetical protein CR513_39597, partial [Mucuna pruriens]
MSVPKTKREVTGFWGRLNYIARFISQLTTTYAHIFKMLCKHQKAKWDGNCQVAFEKIKEYLREPPVLVLLVPLLIKAIKGSVLAEYLAHNALIDYQPMRQEFLDEEIMPEREIPILQIRRQTIPAYYQEVEEEVDEKPWYFNILYYIKDKEYLTNISKNNKRTLRRLAMGFLLDGEVFYKRNFYMTLLLCVDAREAKEILEEIHEGAFRTHANGHAMAKKILRESYYWAKIDAYCCDHVRKCHKCQIYADNIHVPPASLNTLVTPWPFSI